MKSSKSDSKTKELEPWVSYTEGEYKRVISELVHFPVKAVNSKVGNVGSGGIRLKQSVLNIPYVLVSSIGCKNICLDYQVFQDRQCQQDKLIRQQINAVINNDICNSFAITDAGAELERLNGEISTIKELLKNADGAVMVDQIDYRFKQVVMPLDDEDIALSPLHAPSMSALIHATESKLINEINNAGILLDPNYHNINRLYKKASLMYGGSKPQNASGFIAPKGVRGMKTQIFFAPPAEDMNTKRVMSIYYQGIPVVTNQLIDQFLKVTDAVALTRKSTMKTKNDIENAIRAFCRSILLIGNEAFNALDDNSHLLPALDEKVIYLDDSVSVVKRGLIIKSERNAEWRVKFAKEVVGKIVNRTRHVKDVNGEFKEIGSGISSDLAKTLESIIKQEVLS